MKFLVAVALVIAASTAAKHNCYKCSEKDPKPCKKVVDCHKEINMTAIANVTAAANATLRCFTTESKGKTSMGCTLSHLCKGSFKCCNGQLCNAGHKENSASLTLPLPPLLLLGITIFISLYLN